MKRTIRCLVFILVTVVTVSSQAQKIDTIAVYSARMKRHIKNVVILPAKYDVEKSKYPVLYLLHGYGGDHKAWLRIKPDLDKFASDYNMIIVMPNGANSWYWDSPLEESLQYDTYVSTELIQYVDKSYRTIASKSGRAVTGLSMGGHGGLWLGINHQDVYGACGSSSGGVDIRPFPNSWEISKSIGPQHEHAERWENHSVINLVSKIRPRELAIIIDCGTEDFFLRVNEELHKKLAYHNIPHDYTVRPGSHNADYWRNSIEYQLLFFYHYFKNASR